MAGISTDELKDAMTDGMAALAMATARVTDRDALQGHLARYAEALRNEGRLSSAALTTEMARMVGEIPDQAGHGG